MKWRGETPEHWHLYRLGRVSRHDRLCFGNRHRMENYRARSRRMSDAPERIWAWEKQTKVCDGASLTVGTNRIWANEILPSVAEVIGATPYVRADLSPDAAYVAGLEAALAALILNIDAGVATLGAMHDARIALAAKPQAARAREEKTRNEGDER